MGLKDKEAVVEAAKALNIGYIEVKDLSREKIKSEDLFVIGSSLKDKDSLSKAIETGVPVLSLNPDSKLSEFLVTPLANGLLLEDKDKILLIPRKEMNYVAYDINF